MTSVFNTDASLPYNHDLFESLIVKKRVKVDGGLSASVPQSFRDAGSSLAHIKTQHFLGDIDIPNMP
ncbi:hypothetical protein T265_07738 [Opisthorchis viverrini]|uniref:Uncharacterized protein n=1 Tax=Opisthorchis viverrini TaxID=6198 RepID=A0A074ZMQ5_OPIVI|nr:hypothetical protein T265_07738 [Opisthorchis viverrini]KER24640.1 hypothetical protein T265_07738 [Opisthorchis viverrini]